MEYEIIAGFKVPLVYREKGTREIECPYCFKKHDHGTAEGHRLSHCSTKAKKIRVIVGDAEVDYTFGYSIKTLN